MWSGSITSTVWCTFIHPASKPGPGLALVYAGLGDADAVFDWLNRAYAARDVHLMFLTVDVKWDRDRADPRFGDLLARCGFTTVGTRARAATAR